jgi:hypothetical protein
MQNKNGTDAENGAAYGAENNREPLADHHADLCADGGAEKWQRYKAICRGNAENGTKMYEFGTRLNAAEREDSGSSPLISFYSLDPPDSRSILDLRKNGRDVEDRAETRAVLCAETYAELYAVCRAVPRAESFAELRADACAVVRAEGFAETAC